MSSVDILSPGQSMLSHLSLNPETLRSDGLSRWQKVQYRAVINWLTKYTPPLKASNLETVRGYLEACHHLFELENWEAAAQILSVRMDTPTRDQLHNQLNTWGYYREQLDLFNRLLGKLNPEWEMALLNGLGNLHNALSDYNTAIDYQRQHLIVAQAVGDRTSEGLALGNIGLNFYFLGNYPQSIHHTEQSLAIVREIGDRRAEGAALGNLGLVYDALGDFAKAIDYLQQHLAITRAIDDYRGQKEALGNLGVAHHSLGNFSQAIDHHQQSLEISRQVGARFGEGQALGNLGLAYASLGDYVRG
jgi:tetratricopeptide (TPR) repeat protein